MWAVLAVLSAVLLGFYDVAKKQALRKNGILFVLLAATAISTVLLAPFLRFGPTADHLRLAFKAVLVTVSWVSGMAGLKLLPLTTVSTIKGSRPVFVILFSMLLFGERLGLMQWSGVLMVFAALYLLGRAGSGEGTRQARAAGYLWMGVSVLAGVASALYDKHIMTGMQPLFVQSWTNLYITLILGLMVLFRRFRGRSARPGAGDAESGEQASVFRPDWWLLVAAVLITAADALYFYALKQPGAMIGLVSVLRRASVVVTFLCGVLVFRERHVRGKAVSMLLVVAGVALILIGT